MDKKTFCGEERTGTAVNRRTKEGERMEAIRQFTLEKLHFPVDGYLYIVKTLTSVDNGKTFYYCGNSQYFKTEEEAKEYKERKERKKGISVYKVTYIDGESLKYRSFVTDADDREQAVQKLYDSSVADFDHQIIDVVELPDGEQG